MQVFPNRNFHPDPALVCPPYPLPRSTGLKMANKQIAPVVVPLKSSQLQTPETSPEPHRSPDTPTSSTRLNLPVSTTEKSGESNLEPKSDEYLLSAKTNGAKKDEEPATGDNPVAKRSPSPEDSVVSILQTMRSKSPSEKTAPIQDWHQDVKDLLESTLKLLQSPAPQQKVLVEAIAGKLRGLAAEIEGATSGVDKKSTEAVSCPVAPRQASPSNSNSNSNSTTIMHHSPQYHHSQPHQPQQPSAMQPVPAPGHQCAQMPMAPTYFLPPHPQAQFQLPMPFAMPYGLSHGAHMPQGQLSNQMPPNNLGYLPPFQRPHVSATPLAPLPVEPRHSRENSIEITPSVVPAVSSLHRRTRKRTMLHEDVVMHCRECGTSETPEWRRGPDGARTLCNACGLYHAKVSKKRGEIEATKLLKERRVSKSSG